MCLVGTVPRRRKGRVGLRRLAGGGADGHARRAPARRLMRSTLRHEPGLALHIRPRDYPCIITKQVCGV